MKISQFAAVSYAIGNYSIFYWLQKYLDTMEVFILPQTNQKRKIFVSGQYGEGADNVRKIYGQNYGAQPR